MWMKQMEKCFYNNNKEPKQFHIKLQREKQEKEEKMKQRQMNTGDTMGHLIACKQKRFNYLSIRKKKLLPEHENPQSFILALLVKVFDVGKQFHIRTKQGALNI